MSTKYSFRLQSTDRRRPLPGKMVIGRGDTETEQHVLLKLLSYLLFFRDRLQIESRLHLDHLPYVPDLIQLDYELRPVLWIECGECSVEKLDRLAVKVPEAQLWTVTSSPEAAGQLLRQMEKARLRLGRYGLIGLDPTMLDELQRLLGSRNSVLWVAGEFEPPELQFDFNGLWFEASFVVLRH